MVANRDFARFLSWTVAIVVIGAFLAVAFVVVVDPYRIYQLLDVRGFNHVKPAPDRYQEEIKLTGVRAAKANVYVLGNSRAEIGLNPVDLPNPANRYVPYNLAISGSGIATARNELEYLHSIGQKPEMIILGVDFLDFLVDPSPSPSLRSAPGRLPTSGYTVDRLKWKFDAMFSLTSVMDALTTLQIQHGVDVQTVSPDGFNPLLEYNKYAREEGYYAIFQQRAMEYAHNFIRMPHALLVAQTGTSPYLDDLRAIVALASQDKIKLQLLIYPYHAQMLAMFEQSGLWPAFEQWKSILAQEVATAKQQNPDARITLWDFSGFSPIQCEPIPGKNDKTSTTQWYWESGHFKPKLGDLMLARLRTKNPSASTPSERLGFPLMPSNLLENQERMARERSACMASAPQVFEDASRLVQDARSQSH